VYFVRHAQSDASVHDELRRPLTQQGAADARRLAQAMRAFPIVRIYSSPYRRSVLTVEPLAQALRLAVEIREGLREREIGAWVDDFHGYCRRQWGDFDFALDGGESLRQAQSRNIAQVQALIEGNEGGSIVIGTHGTALSLILNHYDPAFGVRAFESIVGRMPWVVLCRFQDGRLTDWHEMDTG